MLAKKLRWWREIQQRLIERNISFTSEEKLLEFYENCIADILMHSTHFDDVIVKFLKHTNAQDAPIEQEVQENSITLESPPITNEQVVEEFVPIEEEKVETIKRKTKYAKKT